MIPSESSLFNELETSIYKRGYEDGKADTEKQYVEDVEQLIINCNSDRKAAEKHCYECGLNEAWEYAKKIVKSYCCTLEDKKSKYADLFGDYLTVHTFDISASEAIQKIKEYEEKQKQNDEIKVGDEILVGSTIGYITKIINDKDMCYVLWKDGSCEFRKISITKRFKTGNYFDGITEMLKQIKENK